MPRLTTALTSDVTPERWAQVAGPHGLASLRTTQWLGSDAREVDGAPGTWRSVAGRAVGSGGSIRPKDISLAPGEVMQLECTNPGAARLLRAHQRDGVIALRVNDPKASSRQTLTGIERFASTARTWIATGTFVPAENGATRTVQSVDGTSRPATLDGTVEIQLPGGEKAKLEVSQDEDGFSLVFADGTAQDGGYRFRFLEIEPAVDEVVTLDFARAYLPPCAFSDHYLCPMPASSNRVATSIEAGERRVLRAQ